MIRKANRDYYDEFAAVYERERHDGYHALIDRLEIERHGSIALDLLLRNAPRAEVRDRRGSDDDGCHRSARTHCISHLLCRFYRYQFRADWRLDRYRTGDDAHLGSASKRSLSECIPHLPTGSVSQESNWIDWLTRWAGSD